MKTHVLALALSVTFCATPLVSANTSQWTFVVLGDTRDATQDTPTGVSPALRRIAEAVAAEQPELVIHSGDLINGFYTHKDSPVHGKYGEMFDHWKKAVQPIYDFNSRTGIPLYVVRGNHEDGMLVTDPQLKNSYIENIAQLMPQNGPKGEQGLTYSFTHRQATFIGLDEYSIKELGALRGLVNQPWLDAQLAQTRGPLTFVFGHVPAYKVSETKKGPFPDLYFFPEHRDAFWSSLKKAGVPIYFCGHVHFYCRVTKDGVQQVLIGNGGANMVDFDPGKVDPSVTLNYPKNPEKAADMKVGYMLLTVDESARTVTGVQKLWNDKVGAWETGDTFTTRVP